MIVFEKVIWQNFLSTGNTPIEIVLNESPSTLIIGDNGSGKSTVLDALTFSLFGKPFRRIKKDQLVNSVNGRDCKVEVEFRIGRKKFLIRRGIKPTKFEIYIDGKLLNQDASSRDYQRHLENNILKLNHRSFTQVVILGSSSFIPFMQLTAASRREVVEEILDIKIFSMMNVLLKQKVKDNKEKTSAISYENSLLEHKVLLQKDKILEAKEKSKSSLKVLEKKMKKNADDMKKLEDEVLILKEWVSEWEKDILPKHEKVDEDRTELKHIRYKMDLKSSVAKNDIEFFENNDECPTCDQHIDEEFKSKAIEERTNKMITTACTLTEIDARLTEMDARFKLYEKIEGDKREHEVNIAKKTASSESILDFNEQVSKQINDIHNAGLFLEEDKKRLQEYREDTKRIQKEREKIQDQATYFTIAKQLLQDSGIKTKIIKKYLPIMNKLVNSYLNQLEFQVKFELDEQFNETIKSRYRDVFSYDNFSEGEKMRIDLALLFTWRQIAKMKNSTNTNLLVLDEIFDSSLDVNGTDEFLKILNTLSNENIFLISHKSDLNVDKFDSLIRFEKVQNFTRLTT
jgi:DNA repair exonuclease SbcCD ATPase subunit